MKEGEREKGMAKLVDKMWEERKGGKEGNKEREMVMEERER